MRVTNVAKFFDKSDLRDAYSAARLGRGQLDLFDDAKREGTTVARRILSTVANWLPPARRVLSIAGQDWIIGERHPDQFLGQTIRARHILHRSDGLADLLTGFQLLTTGDVGVQAHAARLWVKDIKDVSTTYDLQSQYLVYLSDTENPAQGGFVRFAGGSVLLIRNIYTSVAGFKVLECSELEPAALQTVSFVLQGSTYNPVTEAFTAAPAVNVPAVITRFLDDYEFKNEKMPDAYIGDLRVRLRAADAPGLHPGDTITYLSKTWKILSADPRDDATVSLHVRPAV